MTQEPMATSAFASDSFCPVSERVDGKFHSWNFVLDNPTVECHFCGQMRDALSGKVLREGRTP